MDSLKRERIARQFNSRIQVEEVPAARVLAIRSALEAKLSLPKSSGLALARALRAKALPAEVSVESNPAAIEKVLAGVAGERDGAVFLNWSRWTKLDCTTIVNLIEAFSDLWYPKADDLDVLSVALDWIVSIDCDGWLYVARL